MGATLLLAGQGEAFILSAMPIWRATGGSVWGGLSVSWSSNEKARHEALNEAEHASPLFECMRLAARGRIMPRLDWRGTNANSCITFFRVWWV